MTALQTVPIDALVTDVNLPGVSGPDFARTARALRPGVGIVFATGDTASVADETDAIMLEKPYGLDALAAAVLASLGETILADPLQAATPTNRLTDAE